LIYSLVSGRGRAAAIFAGLPARVAVDRA